MNKHLSVFIGAYLIIIGNCFSEQIPIIHNYDIKDGLVHAKITAITQDSKGFMWIGTDEGLHRFDGKTFKIYQTTVGLNSIPSNRITYLYTHPTKDLVFIGCIEGYFSVYNLSSGLFTNFKLNKNGTESNEVNAVSWFDEGKFIIGLSNPGSIFVYNADDNSIKEYVINIDNNIGMRPNNINHIFIDNDQSIYISTNVGLLKSNRKLDHFHLIYVNNSNGGSLIDVKTVSQIDGNLLLISTAKSILSYDKRNQSVEDITPKQFRNIDIRFHIQDDNGNIWLATSSSGLIKFNLKSGVCSQFESNPQQINSIKNNFIFTVYSSAQEPIIWVGTKKGLSYFGLTDNPFMHYLPYNVNDEIIDDSFGLLQANDGSFWICGKDNLYYSDNIEHQFKGIDKTNHLLGELENRHVYRVFEDKQNNLWFATTNGLLFYDYLVKKLTIYKISGLEEPYDKNSNWFTNIYYYRDTLWLPSKAGFCSFDMINKKFTTFPAPSDFSDKQVMYTRDILYDSDGYIWLGERRNGVYRYNLKTREYKHYTSILNDSSSLSSNGVLSFFKDSRGNLWVTTFYNGVSRFNRENKTFKRYSMVNGLPSNVVYGIMEDDKGNLWMSTNKGISKYHFETDKFYNYSFFDGLFVYEFNMSSFAQSKDGRMFFGGIGGIVSFKPNDIKEVVKPPTIYLTEFYIQNKEVPINSAILKNQSILSRDQVELEYKKTTISFDVTLLNYLYPHRSGFAWKLNNYDYDWTIARPNQTAISYTNLPPGSYNLLVKTTGDFENWSQEKKVIKITIIPPWWMTIWFKIAVILIIIFGVLSFYNIRIHYLNKQKEHLSLLVQEKTEELKSLNESLEESNVEITAQNEELELHRHFLELQVSERTTQLKFALQRAEESDRLKSAILSNMSHEVRTPLNAIVGFTKFINDESYHSEERKEFADVILSNSMSLLFLFDNIIELSRFQSENYKIENNLFYVNDFLNAFLEVSINQFPARVPLIKEFPANDQFQFNSDKFKIQITLKNLLSNAFKYTEKGFVKIGYRIISKDLLEGKVDLNIESESNRFIQFYVEDTGLGIDLEKSEIIFDLFAKGEEQSTKLYQGLGLGLTVCKLTVEILGGTIWYESLNTQGTVFNFALPLNEVT